MIMINRASGNPEIEIFLTHMELQLVHCVDRCELTSNSNLLHPLTLYPLATLEVHFHIVRLSLFVSLEL